MPRRAAELGALDVELDDIDRAFDLLVGADDIDVDWIGVARRLVEAALVRPDEEAGAPRRVAERLGDDLDPVLDAVRVEILAENVQHARRSARTRPRGRPARPPAPRGR